MRVRKVQIVNYGPIDNLDITFPFNGDAPKPVLLVGENGSGKSIVLSHIMNGLAAAKDISYPETPEVDIGKVYKLRSNTYIKSGSEVYFARVDFDDGLLVGEIRSKLLKREYSSPLSGLSGSDMQGAWSQMDPSDNDSYFSNIQDDPKKIRDIFSENCLLYFPHNRFEEPAWLNEENLRAKADYTDRKHMEGYTSRRLINYSPLGDNRNWLFDVIYDRTAFELQTPSVNLGGSNRTRAVSIPIFAGYSGDATSVYDIALRIVRGVMKAHQNAEFRFGSRRQRVVSLEAETGQIVPNVFQLSSGETSLLNLFLSILRDFDLSGATFSTAEDIRGIVVVDEIDLHLHAVHQYEVLPKLMKMFPNVQFVVTTHSPLFVLGMSKLFGEDGFGLYLLPSGQQLSPEEFSEFESAYQSFTETRRFTNDVRTAIEAAQKPIVFVEGVTDVCYLKKAAEHLDRESLLAEVELEDGGGVGNLKKTWRSLGTSVAEVVPQKVVLLFDCEGQEEDASKGNVYRRTIPLQAQHPISKGIENLFESATLQRARQHKPAFINIDEERRRWVRGNPETVSETWTIDGHEKTNLCNWLCEHGTEDDFQHFEVIFELLKELLSPDQNAPEGQPNGN